jgi:hypothetical protein
MVSRENRVLLASTALVALGLAVGAAADLGTSALYGLLLFVGVGVVAPQLYLAATDDEFEPRTRIRTAALLGLLFVWGSYGTATDPTDRQVVGAVGAVLLVGLVGYEVVAGYRETRPDAG